MLRSTKLLPLCKGAARNWIVAGTVYGPKATTDGSGTDDNNRRDETNPDPTRTGSYQRKPAFQRSTTQEFSKTERPRQQPQPQPQPQQQQHAEKEEVAKTLNAVVRDHTAFRPTGFRPRSTDEGLASVGRFSYKASAEPVEDCKESGSESAAHSPASETKSRSTSKSEQEDGRRSCEAVHEASTEPPAPAPVFGQVPSFRDLKYEFEKSGLADFRKDSSGSSESSVFQDSLRPETKSSFCEPGLSTFKELQKEVVGTDSSSSRISYSSDASKGNQEAHVNVNRDSTSSTSSGTSQKKSQARHAQHRSRSNNNDSHRLVARVCNILNQHGWGDDAVKALSGLQTNLNAYQLNEILKQQKEAGLAYSFFIWARKQAGYKHDVHTYTTMLGILGRAKSFDVLNGLLGEMIREGCEPNVVTYNRLIHCYGRANDLESSLKLFNVMQMVGCEPDRVTYCTLIDLQAKAGFHDSAMDLYGKMQQAGFRPDTFTYSIIIHCLGKAGKLNAAYKLFCEMTDRGFAPSLVTYNIIIDLHAKAGKFDMALKLYNDLQEVGYSPDRVTYGIIMEVLGNCGHIEDAEHVFEQMVRAGWVADNPVFGLMVDMWGKTGNAEKAAEWFNRMLDSGLQPNVPACNSLLSAYLRACFYEAAEQVLRSMLKWGLLPTLQTYTSLLSSCSACRVQWEYDLIFALMNRTGHPAHSFLCSLLSQRSEVFPIRHFFDAMQFEEMESRRGFADSLIDFLHKAGKGHAAGKVWEVAAEKNLYPYAVKEKSPNYWSINLHVMSMGTALVVLSKTLSSLREMMLRTGAAPSRIDIITGWGRRSRVPGASLVKQAVEDMLRTLHSPFYLDASNFGCFVGQGPALMDWLKKPQLEQQVLQFA